MSYGPDPEDRDDDAHEGCMGRMMDDEPVCPACGGEGTHLGTLGSRSWFRCRQCGLDFVA